MVEVPLRLLPELAGRAACADIRFTGYGSVLLRGDQVDDPVVLAELDLPTGESAVEIKTSRLPELAGLHA
ncbi:hypothetical protein [Tamaricihabitans halophyticus]|uniref:hypothetical protein n=1 Tax=Tamaricihabitans halophyticus TaxID=1262583 RepID=UPI00104C4488|nr:hypothetical protein [Tamaricihabitans halophyticus]